MMNRALPSQQRIQDIFFFKHDNTQQLKAEDILVSDQTWFYEQLCYVLNIKHVVSILMHKHVTLQRTACCKLGAALHRAKEDKITEFLYQKHERV